MNEEALKYAHELFTKDGYTGSLDEYKQLIASDKEALDYSYELFKKDGYKDDVDTFQGVLGVKKKEPTTQGSPTPAKPLSPSGFKDEELTLNITDLKSGDVIRQEIKTREQYIKDITVEASNAILSGDEKRIEFYQKALEFQKEQLEEYKNQNNIAIKNSTPKVETPFTKIVEANPIYKSKQEAEVNLPTQKAREAQVQKDLEANRLKQYRATAPSANTPIPLVELEAKEKELRPTEFSTTPEYENVRS
jgi:hypothetical protein